MKKTLVALIACMFMFSLFAPIAIQAGDTCGSWVTVSTHNNGCHGNCGLIPEWILRAQHWREIKVRVCVRPDGTVYNQKNVFFFTKGCC